MSAARKKYFGEIIDADVSITYKFIFLVHTFETDFSESLYKYWCKITGRNFERREATRPNACILVTKRSSHLFASSVIYLFSVLRPFGWFFWQIKTFAFGKSTDKPIQFNVVGFNWTELEIYELNCPEESSFGQGQKENSFAFKKKEDCVFCGRCLEIKEGDRKIVGKF